MGKKKFIDKKKAATFQLMARDTSDPRYSSETSGDQVFVRVDNSQYTPEAFIAGSDNFLNAESNSIFADAPEDCVNNNADYNTEVSFYHKNENTLLPDHIRREILELGFPDDGYNYLIHMREIKNTGGGSAYYHNPKARVDQIPRDVKAYDASRVEIAELNDASLEKSISTVASKTVSVRLQKALDPDVAALLDASDSSMFGSDIEDLEEDFVIKANHLDIPLTQEIVGHSASNLKVAHLPCGGSQISGGEENEDYDSVSNSEEQRVRRPLDEEFDLLELHEYGSEYEEYNGCMDEFDTQESLAEKLSHAFKSHPSELLQLNREVDDTESPELTAAVIRRCKEYAEKYQEENHDDDLVLFEESSDESEVWDCETIVSTYSTFDNHPGKIGVPELRRKKKIAEAFSGTPVGSNHVITLKGKEKLPLNFLPRRAKQVDEKKTDDKDVNYKRTEVQKRSRSEESKEEKKERKSAVKLERREARRTKKEIKGIYRSEAQLAQKVAAFTGPSSIHLK